MCAVGAEVEAETAEGGVHRVPVGGGGGRIETEIEIETETGTGAGAEGGIGTEMIGAEAEREGDPDLQG